MGVNQWVKRSSAISAILATTVSGFTLPNQLKKPFGCHDVRSITTSLQLVDSARVSVIEALQKPSKILTTCLEYNPLPGSSELDVTVLSMQLRKAGAASIWTSDLNSLQQFKEEQATAMGNFPGPCPIVYNGDKWQDAMEGVPDAIVLPAGAFSAWKELSDSNNVQVIFSVSCEEHIKQLSGNSDTPLTILIENSSDHYDQDVLSDLFSRVPSKYITILQVDAMQINSTELSLGRSLKSTHGCTSVLVKNACVGDAEDVPYASFIVNGFKSKKSTSFDMTGLTGSTNGHFGGIASSGTQKWQRVTQKSKGKSDD
mmetsp:Transcript_25596/g.37217  ORF Transcript_25596/g.37217 Transcript_25596/m.37217 type:complete len:314 (+) Transcript_25596:52-993(+)